MTEIVFVPHTHWDREWYEPFQRFRFLLVEMFDEVLARLEADPEFRFTLDGQTAAIEDYLEMRPENRDRVIARNRAGQLALGPFHILLDEFLCSGETIVRNLALGIRGATALGGAMPLGYLPDMFGHAAQMPQILAQAGLRDAAMWRGIPGRVAGHAFQWVAPSGDSVRVEYLFDGYGNGLALIAQPEMLTARIADFREQTSARYGDEPALAMVGSDHTSPDPELMSWIRASAAEGVELAVATIAEYALGRAPARERVEGELRAHVRGNILPGVISIRRPLKVAMAAAERSALTAERVAREWGRRDYSPFLDLAWRQIIESTAHDSVVGSGVDETVLQVRARLEQAEQLGRAVRDAVLRRLARQVPADAELVVNTLPRPRTVHVPMVVEAAAGATPRIVTAAGTDCPSQVLAELPTELGDETIPATELARIFYRIHGRELYGKLIDEVTFDERLITFHVSDTPRHAVFDLEGLRRRLAEISSTDDGRWRVRTVSPSRVEVLVELDLAPSGSVAVRPFEGTGTSASHVADPVHVNVRDDVVELASNAVRVRIGPDGLATIAAADGTTLEGVGRIVDGGDRGDSYNYGPPADDQLIDTPSAVSVTVEHEGPLLGSVAVRRWYDWPTGLADHPDKRSGDTAPVEVLTRYELRHGEPLVHLTVSFVNQARNHRARLHLPLPAPVTSSAAMGQLAVTCRGLSSEGGGGEHPIPTFPAYEFVSAGPVTVLVPHATEYELVDGGRELALTMLRAVGMISVNVHPLRDEPAAAEIAIPGGQEIGTLVTARFALLIDRRGWQAGGAVELAEAWLAEPLAIRGTAPRGGPLAAPTSGIEIDAEHIGLSALRRIDERTDEIRLVNYASAPATAVIGEEYRTLGAVDLLGRPADGVAVRRTERGWEVTLGAAKFATLHATRD